MGKSIIYGFRLRFPLFCQPIDIIIILRYYAIILHHITSYGYEILHLVISDYTLPDFIIIILHHITIS